MKKQTGGPKVKKSGDPNKLDSTYNYNTKTYIINGKKYTKAEGDQLLKNAGASDEVERIDSIGKRKRKKGGMKKMMYKSGGFLEPKTPNLDDL